MTEIKKKSHWHPLYQPVAPIKPLEPSPDIVIKDSLRIELGGFSCTRTLTEAQLKQLSDPNCVGVLKIEIEAYADGDYVSYDSVSISRAIINPITQPNPNYKSDLKRYNNLLQKYGTALEEYNKDLSEYKLWKEQESKKEKEQQIQAAIKFLEENGKKISD